MLLLPQQGQLAVDIYAHAKLLLLDADSLTIRQQRPWLKDSQELSLLDGQLAGFSVKYGGSKWAAAEGDDSYTSRIILAPAGGGRETRFTLQDTSIISLIPACRRC